MTAVPVPSINRRHDLDALRAIAMLLGIALHGMISFIPGEGVWVVKDTQTSDVFALAIASIHGFRMPLFFVISGFFTMMLLRKRGIKALLKQRFVRIFLPLCLGMFTIIPAVWAVSIYVGMMTQSSVAQTAESENGNSAAGEPILESASRANESGWMFAANGDVDALQSWIEGGGDVHHQEEDGSTALHGAHLFGQAETAQVLIEAGADPEKPNNKGESSNDMLFVPWGITNFVAGLTKVAVTEKQMVDGRATIAKRQNLPGAAEIAKGESNSDKVMFALFYFPLMGHLWFLWFLCWLVAGFSIFVVVGRALRIPLPARWLSASAFRYAWLIPLTMIPQAFMRGEGLGFGPDTSIGMLPMPAVLAYYAIFFGFGAMYFDSTGTDSQMEQFGKRSWIAVGVSVFVLFPVGMAVSSQHDGLGRLASLFLQSSYAWLMTFGLMGVFSQLLSRESKTMRYLSDSSYWLYLAHIPLIIYLQYLIRDYPVSAFIKFPIVCVVASVILLISYHLFVRYTPIGTLLNGKRSRHKTSERVAASSAVENHVGSEVLNEPEGSPA